MYSSPKTGIELTGEPRFEVAYVESGVDMVGSRTMPYRGVDTLQKIGQGIAQKWQKK